MRRTCTILLSAAALALGATAFAQDAQKPEAKPDARADCHGMHQKHERHGKQEKHDHS